MDLHSVGVILIFAIAAGLLLGSFLNVCIARLPQHRSIAWPGSHCPVCKAAIRPIDNVPLLSFLLLRGRCRVCHARISWRYPLVEAGLAALFAFAAMRFEQQPLALIEAAVLCFFLLGLLVMDWETYRLPDSFTLPGTVLGVIQALLPNGGLISTLRLARTAPITPPHWPPVISSLAGALGGAGLLLLIRLLYRLLRQREGMGLGDVKLAALLGAWLGVTGAGLSLMLAVLLGAVAGLLLIARGRQSAGTLRLPFGTFLCVGGLLTLFFGEPILTWYFNFWR